MKKGKACMYCKKEYMYGKTNLAICPFARAKFDAIIFRIFPKDSDSDIKSR